MTKINRPSTAEASKGLLQRLSGIPGIREVVAASLLLGMGACGEAENRRDTNVPIQTVNGVTEQVNYPFNVLMETADNYSVTGSSMLTERGSEEIQSLSLKLQRTGIYDITASAATDCTNKNKHGVRPKPVSVQKEVNPGVNTPVTTIFDADKCEIHVMVTENECFATPKNGQPDMDGDGLADGCDTIDNRPTTETTTPPPVNPDQGILEVVVQEDQGDTITAPSTNATVRLDVPANASPLFETTDAQGKATFEELPCDVTMTRTVEKTGFVSHEKGLQIPCATNFHRNTIILEEIQKKNQGANELIFAMRSYILKLSQNTCFSAAELLRETDANGVMSETPYANPVTYSAVGNSNITVDPATGKVCGFVTNVTADVSAFDGTRITTDPLGVRTW